MPCLHQTYAAAGAIQTPTAVPDLAHANTEPTWVYPCVRMHLVVAVDYHTLAYRQGQTPCGSKRAELAVNPTSREIQKCTEGVHGKG